jgi:hypothetical protein
MSEPSSINVQTEVLRLQRVVVDLLEQHSNRSSEERVEALVQALRGPIEMLQFPARGEVLSALGGLYGASSSVEVSTRLRELEVENRRLEMALATRPTAAPAPAANPELEAALFEALGLGERAKALRLGDQDLERRLIGVLQPLLAFFSELVRSYLGATLDPDRTMGGRFGSLLAEEIEGTAPEGSVAIMIGQIRQQIGAQLLAFREACDSGARDLLRQLAPPALAAGAGEGGVRLLGARPFYYRECWGNFEKKYEELRTADNVYEAYFDGAFRKALHRASRSSDTAKGEKMPGSPSR